MKREIIGLSGLDGIDGDTIMAIAAVVGAAGSKQASLLAIGSKIAKTARGQESKEKAASRRVNRLERHQAQSGRVFIRITRGEQIGARRERHTYCDFITPIANDAFEKWLARTQEADWRDLTPDEKKRIYQEYAQEAFERLPIATELHEERPSRKLGTDEYLIDSEMAILKQVDARVWKLATEYQDEAASDRLLSVLTTRLIELRRQRVKTRTPQRPGIETMEVSHGDTLLETVSVATRPDTPAPPIVSNLPDMQPPSEDAAATIRPDIMSGLDSYKSPEVSNLQASLSAEASESPLVRYAEEYTARGWKVVLTFRPLSSGGCSCPAGLTCKSPGKHPLGGPKAARTVQEIRSRVRAGEDYGLGIMTGESSGIDVLDFDGEQGFELLTDFISRGWIQEEATCYARTARGFHLPVVRVAGLFSANHVHLVAGLDIRTTNGFIVAAPSLHASGKRYEWFNFGSPALQMPSDMVDYLRSLQSRRSDLTSAATRRTPKNQQFDIVGFQEGERNRQLFRIACAKWDRGEDEQSIREELLARAALCSPPYSVAEVNAIMRRVVQYPR